MADTLATCAVFTREKGGSAKIALRLVAKYNNGCIEATK